jgi:hypothetical protein
MKPVYFTSFSLIDCPKAQIAFKKCNSKLIKGEVMKKSLIYYLILTLCCASALASEINPYGFIRCESYRMPLITIDNLDTIKLNQVEQSQVNCEVTESAMTCTFRAKSLFARQNKIQLDLTLTRVVRDLNERPHRLVISSKLNAKEILCSQNL